MVTTNEAAAIISRGNDPQGEGFGIPAVASYSFFGGNGAFTPAQQAAVLVAMQTWSDVARISFFVDNEDPEIGFKNYRANDKSSGHTEGLHAVRNGEEFLILNPDMTVRLGFNLSANSFKFLNMGEKGMRTLIHEMGHAIGLEHPGLYNAGTDVPVVAAYREDSRQYSIMSYLKEKTTNADFYGSSNRTPGLHDIAAAQRLYGANMTTRTGETTYGFGSNAGAAFLVTGAEEEPVFTVWDAGGIDTLNFSGFDYIQFIDLAPEGFSDVGGLKKNIALAAAVDTSGRNSWDANFNPNSIANYIENAIGGSDKDTIYGNVIANQLEGRDGNDILFGFEGKDSLWGGNNDDTLHGGDDNDTLRGENGNDTLNGGAGIDDLYGGDGHDVLDGGNDGSRELMQGEAGNDDYYVWDAMDAISERVGGKDLADKVFTIRNTYSLQQSNYLQGEVENLEFIGTGNFNATGNELNNTIIGGAGNDTISGLEGEDNLQGKGGKDVLDGGTGYDTLTGGSQNDIYLLFTVSGRRYDKVVEHAGGGIDQIQVRDTGGRVRSYVMAEGVEIGAIVGAEADQFTLIGNKLANILYDDVGDNILVGGGGDDRLNGGYFYGGDVLRGGEGDDIYELDLRRGIYNYVEEAANEGHDRVILTAFHEEDEHYTDAYTLTANVEDCELLGSVDFDLYGNDANNRLFGNDYANIVSGLAGNDTLVGRLGDDVLIGGEGNDKYFLEDLIGGDGIRLTHYDDVVEDVDGGIDTVIVQTIDNLETFADGYTLTANVENGTVVGSLEFYLEGNELGNLLTGNAAANTLYGLGGNDTLKGGLGDDILIGGDGKDEYVLDDLIGGDGIRLTHYDDVVEDVDGGIDTVIVRAIDNLETFADGYTLTANVENGTVVGTLEFYLEGNELDNLLTGNAAANTLYGLGGNDTLTGGKGVDRFYFASEERFGKDVITDFDAKREVLVLSTSSGR
jgi:Ca2+-binding RTX toxin-like protein